MIPEWSALSDESLLIIAAIIVAVIFGVVLVLLFLIYVMRRRRHKSGKCMEEVLCSFQFFLCSVLRWLLFFGGIIGVIYLHHTCFLSFHFISLASFSFIFLIRFRQLLLLLLLLILSLVLVLFLADDGAGIFYF